MYDREVLAEGHIVDSGIMSEILDEIIRHHGRFKITEFEMGQTNQDASRARVWFSARSAEDLEVITDRLMELGCVVEAEIDLVLKTAPRAEAVPEDFYSTTNHKTEIKINGTWRTVSHQRMDAVIVVKNGRARCTKLRDVKRGDRVVCGHGGIRVKPEFKQRDRSDFAFMTNEVSSEKKVELAVRRLARELKTSDSGLVVVAGPVVVHTGGADDLGKLIRKGHVSALLSGNALAVHDIEQALYGTSLGVDTRTGVPQREGHKNHMRAINAINSVGGIAQAVKKKVLRSGIMYDCVRARVPYVLAGSLRDDGPLPDTITDMNQAQEAYAKHLQDTHTVLMLSSMLHSIATGNMLPSWVKTICVDINPSVVTKLMDRGSSQALGVVTDVGLFLHLLARRI
jgi:lysine-ketoglutarate reductase/saccharopine dehydrogenase-like protein (TIGR00300 family)